VAYVHQQLLDACAAGSAVLLISEDLDEIFALADRIAVMHHGRLTPARPTAQWTLASIGLAMAGGSGDQSPSAPAQGSPAFAPPPSARSSPAFSPSPLAGEGLGRGGSTPQPDPGHRNHAP
jgi:simple sugar transport system ATP-binding protein